MPEPIQDRPATIKLPRVDPAAKEREFDNKLIQLLCSREPVGDRLAELKRLITERESGAILRDKILRIDSPIPLRAYTDKGDFE